MLPRFVRAGDRIEAGVVISTKRLGATDVDVRAKAAGLALEGPAARRVRLEADGLAEVRFAFRAERAGTARFDFDVAGGGERDRVSVERRVLVPATLEATALYGSTTAAAAEKLGVLRGVRPDSGGLELSVSASPLVGLESAVAALAEYPYECSEQLASRVLPLVALSGIVPREKASSAVVGGVEKLVARQLPDGGFGFWSESTQSDPWVSAYALLTLEAAKRRGVELPRVVLPRGREYLRRFLSSNSSERVDAASMTFMVDVLSLLGYPDEGYMNRLFKARAELPLFARSLLLSAFARAKTRGDQTAILTREIEGALRVVGAEARVVENTGDAYAVLLDSPARTQALVLRAFALARPEHPLLVPLVRGLLAARRGGVWRTTQETAFSLVALDAYREVAEKESPDFEAEVRFGQRELVRQKFRSRTPAEKTANLGMSELWKSPGAGLVFEKDGRGTLHYQVRLRYARAELPASALDAGFYVEKRLSRTDQTLLESGVRAKPSDPTLGFHGGDLVLAELLVTNPEPREYVVIDDPLPAGFEAVNSAFLTTAVQHAVPDSEPESHDEERDRRARGRATRPSVFRRELRDDRVLFFVDHLPPGVYRYRYLARATTLGRFVVPPSRVEAMYAPEFFGRTAATEVIVE